MRCREAKIRMTDPDRLRTDIELLRHIESCAECARAAEAQQLLNATLAVGRERTPASDFSALRTRLEARSGSNTRKELSAMSIIHAYPKLTAGLAIAIAAFLFVTLVPFSYHKTVGYELVYSQVSNDQVIPQQKILQGLKALGYESAGINHEILGDHSAITVTGLPDEEAALAARLLFGITAGIQGESEVRPVVKEVSGSLYAQVMENIFTVRMEIDTEGKTDAEIAQEIIARLQAAGWDWVQADVKTAEDGTRQIQIEMGSDK